MDTNKEDKMKIQMIYTVGFDETGNKSYLNSYHPSELLAGRAFFTDKKEAQDFKVEFDKGFQHCSQCKGETDELFELLLKRAKEE